MLSKTCEYGIRATVFIALQSILGNRTSLKYIAVEIDSPEAFIAKILQKLVKDKIIESVKGLNGGFEISREKIKSTKLSEIIYALDGYDIRSRCMLGLPHCSPDNPCSVHHKYKPVRDELLKLMTETTIEEMALGVKDKMAILR